MTPSSGCAALPPDPEAVSRAAGHVLECAEQICDAVRILLEASQRPEPSGSDLAQYAVSMLVSCQLLYEQNLQMLLAEP
jgi:hypothetical protein